MRRLKTNQSKITKPLSREESPYHAARVNVSRLSSRSEKRNIFFDVDIVETKEIEMWLIVVCTLINNEYASLPFSQTFFRIVSAC